MVSLLKDEDLALFKSNDLGYILQKIQDSEDAMITDIVTSSRDANGNLVQVKQISISVRFAKYLAKTKTDDIFEIINALISLLMSIFFAVDTYYDGTPPMIILVEFGILIIQTLDFLLFFIISDNRILYAFSFQSIVSYLTIIPTLLVRLSVVINPLKVELLLLCRVFRFFSMLRMDKVFTRRSMTLVRIWFTLMYTFLATVFIFAALMLTIENQNIRETNSIREQNEQEGISSDEYKLIPSKEYEFHDMLYFLIITITTVGYGDIYPFTFIGQMLSIGIIFVILSLIPKQISEFSKINSLISPYSRISYQKSNSNSQHILLLGDAHIDAIKIFLAECFHPDHGYSETDLVIMRNAPPTDEINTLIKSPNYMTRVTYIQGNPLFPQDLKRSLVENAGCCVILSNQFSSNPVFEDKRNILHALSVKKYVRAQSSREIRLCLQLLKPENKNLYSSTLSHYGKVDQVLCSEELKLQLIAKSSICPGIITIIWSLITSNPANSENSIYDSPEDELKVINEKLNEQRDMVRQHFIKKKKNQKSQLEKRQNRKVTNFQKNDKQEDSKFDERNSNDVTFNDDRLKSVPNPEEIPNKYENIDDEEFQDPAINMDSKMRDQLLNGYKDSGGEWKEIWQINYESGTNYELYRILLKHPKFEGLRFRDVCMILFHKVGAVMIALEVKIMNQVKVFVNPFDYVLQSNDYYGYIIYHEKIDVDVFNNLDLSPDSAENFCIFEYITKQESTLNKKDLNKMEVNLAKSFLEEKRSLKYDKTFYDNYFTSKKPIPLSTARVKGYLDKAVKGHIIICGLISGIKNLILPLRVRSLGNKMVPIVILTEESEDNESSEYFQIWGEINRFEDVYILKGSALNPIDLQRARVQDAKSIIIVAKERDGQGGEKMLDADAIFMYKTIEANFKNLHIVTELASLKAIAFLDPGNEDRYQKLGYFMSKPFASGEIYVSSLLDSLMCQTYYNPKMSEILDQLILGSANTSEKITKHLKAQNLTQCSLQLVDIPKRCLNMNPQDGIIFDQVFEACLKHFKMIIIAVYKRDQNLTEEDKVLFDENTNPEEENKIPQREEAKKSKIKPYVWIHPPKGMELKSTDQLFVLCDQLPNDNVSKVRTNLDLLEAGGSQGNKVYKNEDKKLQMDSMNKLLQLNGMLQDLLFTTKELQDNVSKANEYIESELALKIKSGLKDHQQ